MKSGITSTGFAFTFDEQRANDMHVLVHVQGFIDPEATSLQKIKALNELPKLLLGASQADALYKHLESLHEGRVPADALEHELIEIIRSEDAGKNS